MRKVLILSSHVEWRFAAIICRIWIFRYLSRQYFHHIHFAMKHCLVQCSAVFFFSFVILIICLVAPNPLSSSSSSCWANFALLIRTFAILKWPNFAATGSGVSPLPLTCVCSDGHISSISPTNLIDTFSVHRHMMLICRIVFLACIVNKLSNFSRHIFEGFSIAISCSLEQLWIHLINSSFLHACHTLKEIKERKTKREFKIHKRIAN